MKWSRFISEFGIESRSDDEGRWLVKGASGEVLEVSPRQLAGEFGLRPIVGEAPLGRSGMTVDFLLSPSGDKALELQLSNLQQETGGIKNLRLEEHWLDLLYVLGAACYHCKRLAFSYGKLTHQAWDSARRQIARRRDRTSRVDLSGTFETYYEFDALVTAVVRCYESMRFVLWSAFGSQQGPIPRSFERTLKVCTKGPGDLREKLASSWARYGKKAKEYRDCIQHYVPVGNSVPSAHVLNLPGGVLAVCCGIPDNPEARSWRQFRYALGLDALRYGWHLTNEVVQSVRATVASWQGSKDS